MRYTSHDAISIPGMHVPGFRTTLAIQNGVANDILFRVRGGLGDQICAEPTLRYALKHFKNCRISLAAEAPYLFSHLKFERVYSIPQEHPDYDRHLVFDTLTAPDDGNLVWQFLSHALMNCVDFPAVCALRSQLPVQDREVVLEPALSEAQLEVLETVDLDRAIFVHPGKHWPSKTFPKDWWDSVLTQLIAKDADVILIGHDSTPNPNDPDAHGRGTVDVDPKGCIDLRGRLSPQESIWLLKRAKVLVTNDSAPLHMAVPGDAWICFIATCKHPDFIKHWRKGQWAWRMKNYGRGGVWEHQNYCPNQNLDQAVPIDQVDEVLLRSWLPAPSEIAEWATHRLDDWECDACPLPEDQL